MREKRVRPEVFKVQRAIYPPSNSVLVYNKDRTIQGQFDMPKDQLDLLFGPDELKVYVLAHWRQEDGKIEIDNKVKARNW